MSSVETQSEIVEITVDSWAATSEWQIQKNGVVRSKSKRAANGSAIRVDGDAKLEFMLEVKERSAA